jgi:hypothetical protein
MEKCRKKDRLYNAITKRCYKSCEQKKKDTHPVTKKCRKRCQSDKIRRVEDFRCVKKTLKMGTNKMGTNKMGTNKMGTNKAKAKAPIKAKAKAPIKAKAEARTNYGFGIYHSLFSRKI